MGSTSQVQLFQSADGEVQLSVSLEQDTVWLTQRQMGELFGSTAENVLMHLKNIFKDRELDEFATTKDFLVVRLEGKREVRRKLKHYSLDVDESALAKVQSVIVRELLELKRRLG